MNALENAKNMPRKNLIEYITGAGLKEYGVSEDFAADVFEKAIGESGRENRPLKLVAALDSSDTSGALLGALESEREKFFEGMEIAALALGNPEKILHLPEYAPKLLAELEESAAHHGVTIVSGPVDRRAYTGSSIHHIVTMVMLADCLAGNDTQYMYVSVNEGELRKLPEETKINSLIETEKAKGLKLGYRLHPVADSELTIKEANITNGVVNVLTENDCIIQETEKSVAQSRNIGCGKCVFCREGIMQMEVMHKDIIAGKGKMEYLSIMNEIGEAMKFSTYCSLGQKAGEIVMSSVEHFRSEYEEHIKKANCPANKCQTFIRGYIDPDKCDGCTECMDVCPADCIEGKRGYIHMIDELDCNRCKKCVDCCPKNAAVLTKNSVPKLPNKLTKCGMFRRH